MRKENPSYKLENDELKPKIIRRSGYCRGCRKHRQFEHWKRNIHGLGEIVDVRCSTCGTSIASSVIAS